MLRQMGSLYAKSNKLLRMLSHWWINVKLVAVKKKKHIKNTNLKCKGNEPNRSIIIFITIVLSFYLSFFLLLLPHYLNEKSSKLHLLTIVYTINPLPKKYNKYHSSLHKFSR